MLAPYIDVTNPVRTPTSGRIWPDGQRRITQEGWSTPRHALGPRSMLDQVDHSEVGQSVERELNSQRGEQEAEHLLGPGSEGSCRR